MEKSEKSNVETNTNLFKKELDLKLTKALVLRDYAIENNYDVPDETLNSLGIVQEEYLTNNSLSVSSRLDRVIITLTQLIYPTNYESILISRKSENQDFDINRFKKLLFIVSILFLGTGMFSYYILCECKIYVMLSASALSISLGALGSLVYIMFNLIGVLNESAFNARDTFSNYLRILIGSILGWIFYFVFAQDSFHSCLVDENKYIYLFLPFLVGFSTKLVVGVLNQAIKAFELILGIDNKDAEILTRRRNRNFTASKK